MFNYIFCRKKLPLCTLTKGLKVDWKNMDFQTKDMDCLMNTYEITPRGRLRQRKNRWFWKDEEPSEQDKEPEWINSDYTGSINFYATVYSEPGYIDIAWENITEQVIEDCDVIEYWVEFVAIFYKGKLEELEWYKTDAHPVKEQLINEKRWYEERLAKDRLIQNRIKRVLRKVPGYRQLTQSLRKFVEFQSKIVNKLYY